MLKQFQALTSDTSTIRETSGPGVTDENEVQRQKLAQVHTVTWGRSNIEPVISKPRIALFNNNNHIHINHVMSVIRLHRKVRKEQKARARSKLGA